MRQEHLPAALAVPFEPCPATAFVSACRLIFRLRRRLINIQLFACFSKVELAMMGTWERHRDLYGPSGRGFLTKPRPPEKALR